MARIFISYASDQREQTQALAEQCKAVGHTVWCDTELISGDAYRDVIDRELEAADAVVAIWTPSSVRSPWVIAEADHGLRLNKLVPLRSDGLEPWQIPKPFGTLHTELVSDRAAVLRAIERRLGISSEHPRGDRERPIAETALASPILESQVTTLLTLMLLLMTAAGILSAFWVRTDASDKAKLLTGGAGLALVCLSVAAGLYGRRTRTPIYAALKTFNWSTFAVYGWGVVSLTVAYWPDIKRVSTTLSVCAFAMAIVAIMMLAQSRGASWVLTTARVLAGIQIVGLGAHVARQFAWAGEDSHWWSSHPEAFLHVFYVASGLAGMAVSSVFLVLGSPRRTQ